MLTLYILLQTISIMYTVIVGATSFAVVACFISLIQKKPPCSGHLSVPAIDGHFLAAPIQGYLKSNF